MQKYVKLLVFQSKIQNIFLFCRGIEGLKSSIQAFMAMGNEKFTKLIPDLKGVDPDESFSTVPYIKGQLLLRTLEKIVTRPKFEAYLKAHVKKFGGKTVTTPEFKAFFISQNEDKKDELDKFEWDKWFYSTGMPAESDMAITSKLADTAEGLAKQWSECNGDYSSFTGKEMNDWYPAQKEQFLGIITNLKNGKNEKKVEISLKILDITFFHQIFIFV